MTERIRMTEAFLRRKLGESTYFEKHPDHPQEADGPDAFSRIVQAKNRFQ